MNEPRHEPETETFDESLGGKIIYACGFLFSFGYLLFNDYPPAALAAVVAAFFFIYASIRILGYLEENRFSPRRLRVGVSWALLGIDSGTDEYDTRPVRVYFLLLAILFLGLMIRPMVAWTVAG